MNQRNLAASVRARLLNKARANKLDFNLLLTRYAIERMLYRLSISTQRAQFLLKGALLFDLWLDVPHRPTLDADLLGFGSSEISDLEMLFREICRIDVEDGIVFDADTVEATEIRKDANYAGVRVTLLGRLDSARCPVQIDIGFGDIVTPGPEVAKYPVILAEMPQPELRVYPRYTVIAEKLEAMVSLGMLNSRMKDFFDLCMLSRHSELDGAVLAAAIRATFERRGTRVPTGVPLSLTDQFALDEHKDRQWQAFQRKNKLEATPLPQLIAELRDFLLPVLAAVSSGDDYQALWRAGAGWGEIQNNRATFQG